MDSHQAAHEWQEIERVRGRARVDLRSVDIPLLVFGVLMVGSAAVSDSGPRMGAYWGVAAPVGTLVTVWLYRRRGRGRGIAGSSARYFAVSLGIAAAAFAAAATASAFGSALAAALAPMSAVAIAYVVLGWLARSALLAALGAALAAAVIGLWLAEVEPDIAALVLALAVGGSLLLAGIGCRFVYRGER